MKELCARAKAVPQRIAAHIRCMSWKRRLLLGAVLAVAVTGLVMTRTQALVGFVDPDGDVSRGFTVVAGCTTTTHFSCVNGGATNNTASYVSTGTGGTTGEIEEFTMTSVAGAGATVRRVVVSTHMHTAACNGNAPNCDQVAVAIRIGGALQASTNYTLTTANALYTTVFEGSWTSDVDLQVQLTRTRVGGGNAGAADDDVQVTNVRAEVTYSNNSSFQQASYRWFENSDTLTSNDNFNKLPGPTALPASISNDNTFSSDGQYLSVAHFNNPFITIYKRSGDTFTKLADPATLPTGTGHDTAWSPDGQYMSVSHSTAPFITIYKRSGDTFTKLADPAILPAGGGSGVTFSNDSIYMSVSHATSPFITIYKRSGDTFTKLADPAALPTGTGRDTAFSPDGTYLSISHDISPFITIYKRSGDTFTKLADPAALPNGIGRGTAYSPDGTYLSVAHDVSPFITIYKRSGDTFTKLADPAALPTGNGRGIDFSSEGTYLSVAHSTSPFITIYKRSGDTFTKLADPAALPTDTANGTAFSADGQYLSVALFSSPYVTLYKIPTFVGVGAALAIQDTAVTAPANGAPVRLRMNVKAGGGDVGLNDANFRLQYAARGSDNLCDTSFTGESYADVEATTGPVRYYNNTRAADGMGLTAHADDPVFGTDPIVRQQYDEANPTTVVSQINTGSLGMWDFALDTSNAPDSTTYCFRMIRNNGSVLQTYTVVPQISTVAPAVAQKSWRLYDTSTTATPGAPLAAQNTAASVTAGASFRMRQLLEQTAKTTALNAGSYKVQYAAKSGTCDIGFSGETYKNLFTPAGPATANPSTAANDASIGTSAWSNPGNALASDNVRAEANVSLAETHYLKVAGFNFSIPATATITGVEVLAEVSSNIVGVQSIKARLVKGGIIGATNGTNALASWPTTEKVITYGTSTDMWGMTLSPADANAADFGFAVQAFGDSDLMLAYVDAIQMKIHYSDTTAAGALAYHTTTGIASGTTIAAHANDPTATGTIRPQTFASTDPFTNSVSAISFGESAMWDFAVSTDPSASGAYCIRIVNSNETLLGSYSAVAEVTITGTNAAPAAPTLSAPAAGATGVSVSPSFQLRTTDADNDYLRYRIQVCSVSDCSTILRTIDQTASQTGWTGQDAQTGTAYIGSSTLTSSTLATHAFQDPALTAGTQYWWRAYAADPGGSNTWSSASTIQTFTTAAAAAPAPATSNTYINGGGTFRGGTRIGN